MNARLSLLRNAAIASAAAFAFSPTSANANTRPARIARVAARAHVVRRTTPSGCTSDYSANNGVDYFTGINPSGGGVGNYADADLSAVIAGASNETCSEDSAIGTGQANTIGTNFPNAQSFVGAGYGNAMAGAESFTGAGFSNLDEDSNTFMGAGSLNESEGNGGNAIGAGDVAFADRGGSGGNIYGNLISGIDAFVGAGDLNREDGSGSFIGGGGYVFAAGSSKPTSTNNETGGSDAFVGAGDTNGSLAAQTFLGAGANNALTSEATSSSIVGGANNLVENTYAAVLGGYGSSATGAYAIVPDGNDNHAGATLGFAAGYRSSVNYAGSFAWADYTSNSTPVEDSAKNQFIERASGGTYVYSNEAATSGVVLMAGSGTWASLSDRNAKTAIVRVDDDAILERLATLPVDAWHYRSELGVRHVGPMAQDFYAAFGTGTDDRHITSIDEDGVALAAIQALNAKVDGANAQWEKETRAIASRNHVADRSLDARIARLQKTLVSLTKRDRSL